MKMLTAEQFELLLAQADMKPKFRRDLKFRLSVEGMDAEAWHETELLPIWNKSKNGGVLLVQPADELFLVAFDATQSGADASGRTRSVICDLCFTWQVGKNGGFVMFYPGRKSNRSTALLCCMDLRCSEHVRTKTSAALKSRAQLRENMTNEDRVERLRSKLETFVERLDIAPMTL